MMTLIAAALVAAQPVQPADSHAQMPGMHNEAAKKDCCKECCKDMGKEHADHKMDGAQERGHAGH